MAQQASNYRRGFALSFLFAGLALAPAAFSAEPLVVGAIGDSLSAGFNAQRLGDNRELSWSTGSGTSINSHMKRLGALRGRETAAFNEAIAGSIVTDLERQVTRMLPHHPEYVTVTIGANDVCTWNPDYANALADFRDILKTQLQRLITASPTVKILLAPIPDLYNLWEIASPHQGCQARWDLITVCKPLLASGVTTAERQAFVQRWQAANDTIADIAAELPANVLHDPALGHTQFEWHHVSPLDCFHPSVDGQNLLAEKAWQLVLASP